MSEILVCFALTWRLIQGHLNWKDCNLQEMRTSLMNLLIVRVYLLLVLHLPLTLAASAVAHVSTIDPWYYELHCHHYFSRGCPIYDHDSWNCAKILTNCTSPDYPYHCILNIAGKVIHVCTTAQICQKGTVPIYDPWTQTVSCEKCPAGHYQPYEILSNNTPVCIEKFVCDSTYHKIECPVEPERERTQDALCRCDARNDWILSNPEGRAMCVPGKFADCHELKCQDGQERLLNYTCAPRCEEGFQRDDRDICMPRSTVTVIPNTTVVNSTMTQGEKALPTTIYSTSLSEKPSVGSNGEGINKYTMIAIIVIFVVITLIVLIGGGVFACWKWQLYKKCTTAINKLRARTRRQSSRDAVDDVELETIHHDTDANAGPGDICNGERLNPDTDANAGPGDTCHGERPNQDTDANAGPGDTCHGERSNQGTNINSVWRELSEDLISRDWKFFFRALSVKENELDQVEIDYQGNVKEQIYQLLHRLNQRGSSNKTDIIQALKSINRHDLANKYNRKEFPAC